MRKSREVPLNLLASLSRFVTGDRSEQETRYCVDEEGRIVPEVYWQNSTLGISYHYIYGGKTEGKIGDVVVGGSLTPALHNPNLHGGFGGRGTAGG